MIRVLVSVYRFNCVILDKLLMNFCSVLGAVGRNGNQECSVCIEEISVENFKRLICGHAFHVACINTWLQENNNCPMCRTEIN